jgi:valyl-tRNA synthetase
LLQAVREGAAPEGAVRDRVAGFEIAIEVGEVERTPLGKPERERLERELEKVDLDIRSARARLGNPQFVERAPAEVVAGARTRLEELEQRREVLSAQLQGS